MVYGLQVLGLPAPEHFPTLLPVSSFSEGDARLVLATTAGGIKSTALSAFEKIRHNGLAATKLVAVRWLLQLCPRTCCCGKG